jgi:hypothetical protein
MSKLAIGQYVRKPFYVDAIQVTDQNIAQVAEWCSGEVRTADARGEDVEPYIQVRVVRPLNDKQTKAYPGDWVLYAGTGYKVYQSKAFKQNFDLVEPPSTKECEVVGRHLVEIDEAEKLPSNIASHNID